MWATPPICGIYTPYGECTPIFAIAIALARLAQAARWRRLDEGADAVDLVPEVFDGDEVVAVVVVGVVVVIVIVYMMSTFSGQRRRNKTDKTRQARQASQAFFCVRASPSPGTSRANRTVVTSARR